MYKKITIVLFLSVLLLLFGCTKSLKIEEINVAVCPDFPPFEYTINDTLDGLDIQLIKSISSKFKVPITFTELPFNQLLESLEKGETDIAISGITVTNSRKKIFDFSVPYYSAKQVILTNESHNITIDSLDTISNYKIAVFRNSGSQLFLENTLVQNHKLSANKIIKTDNLEEMLYLLSSDSIQLLMLENSYAELIKNKYKLKILFESDIEDNFAIAFPKNSQIFNPINQFLLKFLESNEWYIIKERYLLNE
jgi:polar amino acid transport system substrate-binding protein